ncbi:MAG: hypothetical protein LC729_00780, partial [Acidobacteria bacterium]|nr:hypothetical protein [Acidobacteriota bacterium]
HEEWEEVSAQVHEVIERGNGATRQREALARDNRYETVVDLIVTMDHCWMEALSPQQDAAQSRFLIFIYPSTPNGRPPFCGGESLMALS